jgi:hypothetical protein
MLIAGDFATGRATVLEPGRAGALLLREVST